MSSNTENTDYSLWVNDPSNPYTGTLNGSVYNDSGSGYHSYLGIYRDADASDTLNPFGGFIYKVSIWNTVLADLTTYP
jgi:hypothetical protein